MPKFFVFALVDMNRKKQYQRKEKLTISMPQKVIFVNYCTLEKFICLILIIKKITNNFLLHFYDISKKNLMWKYCQTILSGFKKYKVIQGGCLQVDAL